MSMNEFDQVNHDLEARDLYNLEDAFHMRKDYGGAYRARPCRGEPTKHVGRWTHCLRCLLTPGTERAWTIRRHRSRLPSPTWRRPLLYRRTICMPR
jgi:hypothetical protein